MAEEQSAYIKKVSKFREEVFDRAAARHEGGVWLKASLKDIRRLVVIASAPRSGSSLLFAAMRMFPEVYALSGEEVPFYKLNGLSSDAFPSDEVPPGFKPSWKGGEAFSRDILGDMSFDANPADILKDPLQREQYTDDLVLRFSMQWPAVDFSYEGFKRLANNALSAHLAGQKGFDKEVFHLELIKALRTVHNEIDPFYYDIPEDMVRAAFPGLARPSNPPNDVLMIEEPPFILLKPARKATEHDLASKTLVLKSTVNSYKMDFIRELFPNAGISVIYLTRNPGASINGLYDGWLHRGFFSHNLRAFSDLPTSPPSQGGDVGRSDFRGLGIKGYSDIREYGKWWWKYDLPPGWREYSGKRLEEVCAFQWRASNTAILKHLANAKPGCLRLKCEDIIRDSESRLVALKTVEGFLGFESGSASNAVLGGFPVVQATEPPERFRWMKKKDMLMPALEDAAVAGLASELGYSGERHDNWL
mgnify:CR=1 FL=1